MAMEEGGGEKGNGLAAATRLTHRSIESRDIFANERLKQLCFFPD